MWPLFQDHEYLSQYFATISLLFYWCFITITSSLVFSPTFLLFCCFLSLNFFWQFLDSDKQGSKYLASLFFAYRLHLHAPPLSVPFSAPWLHSSNMSFCPCLLWASMPVHLQLTFFSLSVSLQQSLCPFTHSWWKRARWKQKYWEFSGRKCQVMWEFLFIPLIIQEVFNYIQC